MQELNSTIPVRNFKEKMAAFGAESIPSPPGSWTKFLDPLLIQTHTHTCKFALHVLIHAALCHLGYR